MAALAVLSQHLELMILEGFSTLNAFLILSVHSGVPPRG